MYGILHFLCTILFFNSAAADCQAGEACNIQVKRSILSSRCINYKRHKLTKPVRKLILDVHNELRNKVAQGLEKRGEPGPQPSAKSMKKLAWDLELQILAQKFVNECLSYESRSYHATKDSLKYRGGDIGQNVISVYGENMDFRKMILTWYEEVKQFDKQFVEEFEVDTNQKLQPIGSYTQLVWGASHLVGCGHASYLDFGRRVQRFVCNYAPSGNEEEEPVYERGNPCTNCVCDKDFKSLCKNDHVSNYYEYPEEPKESGRDAAITGNGKGKGNKGGGGGGGGGSENKKDTGGNKKGNTSTTQPAVTPFTRAKGKASMNGTYCVICILLGLFQFSFYAVH